MTVELPEGYVPSEDEEYMCDEHLEYFRQKLLVWRSELQREADQTLGRMKEEKEREPDIVDQGSAETDSALELRTRDRARKLIKKIDQALRRMTEGDYGFCEETGEEIGLKRLMARPIATMCIEAQERHERMEKIGLR